MVTSTEGLPLLEEAEEKSVVVVAVVVPVGVREVTGVVTKAVVAVLVLGKEVGKLFAVVAAASW